VCECRDYATGTRSSYGRLARPRPCQTRRVRRTQDKAGVGETKQAGPHTWTRLPRRAL